MDKTTEEFVNFVEKVNERYWEITKMEEEIPLSVVTAGGYGNIIKLDIDTALCSSEDENLEDGIAILDNFIKKIKFLRRAIVNEYCKLSDKQLEYFGVYEDET